MPVEEVKDLCLLLDDLKESFANGFHLNSCLFGASFKDHGSELVNVCLGHLDRLSTWADGNFLTARKNSCKVLVDSGVEIFITQTRGVILHVAQNLSRVSIDSIEILERDLLVQELLPDPGSQVERNRRLAEEGEGEECTKVRKHVLMRGS